MSESETHRTLIRQTVARVAERYPNAVFCVDVQQAPGDAVPPLIENFRPDAYGKISETETSIIIEAKIDNNQRHTHDQVASFLKHLEHQRTKGYFILAVLGTGADRAKTMLRFLSIELNIHTTIIEVFDGNDFWQFGLAGDVKWRLI